MVVILSWAGLEAVQDLQYQPSDSGRSATSSGNDRLVVLVILLAFLESSVAVRPLMLAMLATSAERVLSFFGQSETATCMRVTDLPVSLAVNWKNPATLFEAQLAMVQKITRALVCCAFAVDRWETIDEARELGRPLAPSRGSKRKNVSLGS